MFSYGETVTRLRAPLVTNAYNAQERNWSAATSTPIDGWGVDDSASLEPADAHRELVETDCVLYRPEAADVQASDRVICRGRTYEVVGDPATWRHPMTGWNAGFVVRLRIVKG